MIKKTIAITAIALATVLSGCNQTDARVASRNLSTAADMFELDRRIVFYNTWKGEYMLSIEGRCSIENMNNRVAVTCKTSETEYKKHFLGLTGNVSYFSEQLQASKASVYRYRVIFKPETIIPNIDLETSL